jgi:Tol biopolymer transport system component
LFSQTAKPKLNIDEFFNSVSFRTIKVSPDGGSIIIETERADWEQQIYRKELWLYRIASGTLIQLTQSARDTSPQWSPDGQWIAFLSERKADTKDEDAGDAKQGSAKQKGKNEDNKDKKDKDDTAQLFLISPNGG